MPHHVLVIEDDPTLADVLRMKLKQLECSVSVASNQRDAYHTLDDQRFDFVLLDLRLPTHDRDMDPNAEVGFDILNHIRDRFSQSELPVIVMTAYEESSQTAVRSLKSGANDYITKPFTDSSVSIEDKLDAIRRQLSESTSVPTEMNKHLLVIDGGCVSINGIEVQRKQFSDLLLLLCKRWLSANTPMTGSEIANAMGVQEATVRQNVRRFRAWLSEQHEEKELGPIEDQDVINNQRDWRGYQINTGTCVIRSQ